MSIDSALKMGTESVPEILENFYTLTRLPSREDFIEILSLVNNNNNNNNNILGKSHIIREYYSMKLESWMGGGLVQGKYQEEKANNRRQQ